MAPLLWLHREGNWFILNKNQCGEDMQPYPHESLIWHHCPEGEVPGGTPRHGGYKGMWRLSVRNLFLPCGVCEEVVPDSIAGLWQLHNWETLDRIHFGKWDGSFYGWTGGYVPKVDV